MYGIILHYNILRTIEVEVPNLENPLMLNLSVLKGIHTDYVVGEDVPVLAEGTIVGQVQQGDLLGHAKVFEVKHVVLSDLHRYKMLLEYYHDPKCKTYQKIRRRLSEIYDGIIDGEIVTLVFFTPKQDLLDTIDESNGTTAETTDNQSSK